MTCVLPLFWKELHTALHCRPNVIYFRTMYILSSNFVYGIFANFSVNPFVVWRRFGGRVFAMWRCLANWTDCTLPKRNGRLRWRRVGCRRSLYERNKQFLNVSPMSYYRIAFGKVSPGRQFTGKNPPRPASGG